MYVLVIIITHVKNMHNAFRVYTESINFRKTYNVIGEYM